MTNTILASNDVKELTGKLFTNYDLAYVGNHFSKSFIEWIRLFCDDIKRITIVKGSRYVGRVSTMSYRHFLLKNTSIVYIKSISFNPRVLLYIANNTHFERISKGLPSNPPKLISSTKRATDYTYYSEGGVCRGHIIDIVKKKRSSKKKPQFNYYDRRTKSIMFDFDFYSPFAFINNEAEAWATDGHKYKLPYMSLIETKNISNMSSIFENKNLKTNKKRTIRLTERDLYGIVKKCVDEIVGKGNSWNNYSYVPIAYNTTMRLADNNREVKSLVTLSGRDDDPNEFRWDIIEDDGCYVICNNREIQRNMYIFPELHKTLKELPILPPH